MRLLCVLLLSCNVIVANDFKALLDTINSASDSIAKKTIVDSFMLQNPVLPLTNGTECVFMFRGNADRIIVTGDHKQWSANGDTMKRIAGTDLSYIMNTFPIDARIDYKFINGSNWILDPKNPLTCAGGFGPNSELR
ncbi:MAG: hypothetical protein ACKO2H_06410, partial [Bacteroidota bacterium]